MPGFAYWDSWSPNFAEFDGAIWARKRIKLSAAEAADPAVLSLGVVDDMDLTFVNGVAVGSTNDWSAPRRYKIAPGVLKAGDNEILVYVRDNWGPGGFQGPAEVVKLSFADGQERPLGDGWQYAQIANRIGAPPAAPWDGPSGVGTIRNGMIGPLGPIGLKGVAWYQGEADVGLPHYDARLAAMMNDWRRQFRDDRLPFLIVALAGFGKPSAEPVASGWAALIDEQRRAAAADPNAALVVATDLGERNDIHPANKNDVGKRLALAARSLAYGDNTVALSPLPTGVKRTARGYVVLFTRPLEALSGPRPLGFELCATTQESCRYADARVERNTVLLTDDGRPATRVRYAWSDYPILNLYSGELPAPPFELPVDASSIGR
jgi:sialate O-acetylesterase